jgi:TolA-binding protein
MKRLISLAIVLCASTSAFSQLSDPGIWYSARTVQAATVLMQEGLLTDARKMLDNGLQRFPKGAASDEAVLISASIEREAGNITNADNNLAQFLSERINSPLRSFAWFERGMMMFARPDFQAAAQHFAQAAAEGVKDEYRDDSLYRNLSGAALYWQGASLARAGKYEEARQILLNCQYNYPENSFADDALYLRAQLTEQIRQIPEASALYSELVRSYPRRNTIISSLIRSANGKIAVREPNAALSLLDQADNLMEHINNKDSIGLATQIQSNAANADQEILYLRAEALVQAGQFKQALGVYKDFLQRYTASPLRLQALLGAGFACLNLAEYQNAQMYYEQIASTAVANDENPLIRAGALLYHALVIKALGNKEQAAREFAALNAQPSYPFLAQSLLESAQLSYENGDMDAARKSLERASRESADAPVSVKIHLLLGSVYIEQQAYGKAAREYASAERLAVGSSILVLPAREKILAETRLKQGIALSQNTQYRDAVIELSTFLGEHKSDSRRDEALFWLAESYYRLDLLKNAEEFYKQLISDFPSSKRMEEGMYGLGWTYFRKREFDKSADAYAALIRKFPQTKFAAEALARKGDGHYVMKQYKEAANAYQAASKKMPRSEDGQYSAYQYGQALYRLSDYSSALEAFRLFVRSYPRSPLAAAALYSIGWTHFQQKKYDEAIEDMQNLINAYPASELIARAYYTIGDAYYNTSQFDKAIEFYSIIKDKYPGSPFTGEAIKSIQFCLEELGRPEEALKIGDQFVNDNPNSDAAQDLVINKGMRFYTGKNFQNAIGEYEAFLKRYPDNNRNAEAMYYLGKSLISVGEFARGEASLREVLTKYPKSEFAPQSMLEIGLLRLSQQKLREADTAFLQMVQEFPQSSLSAQAGFERAQIASMLGDSIAALRIYSDVATTYSTTEYGDQSRYRVAMYYRGRGMPDSARVHFQPLVQRMENPMIAAEAQYRIGELWMKQKEYQNAVGAFLAVREKFSNIEDWFTLSLLALGECYEILKNNEGAREIYTTLSSLRAGDDYGRTAQSRLKKLGKAP